MSKLESLSVAMPPEDEQHAGNLDPDLASLLHCNEASEGKTDSDGGAPDVISTQVMAGSKGLALFCIITICLCMSACSFLMLYEFDRVESFRNSTTTFDLDAIDLPILKFDSHDFCKVTDPAEMPLGQRILSFQINVVQNLVHASLLGSAALVATVRGDVLWMYYVRNVAFVFIPIGLVYSCLDIHSVWIGNTALLDHALRLPLSFLSAVAGVTAFAIYTPIFLKIRSLLCERGMRCFQPDPCVRYPRYLAENAMEANLATVIYLSATIVQLLAWVYYATTLFQWLSKRSSCFTNTLAHDFHAEQRLSDLQAFEMAYSSGSHHALLIALFFLAATYPRDIASVGGALLTSSWRILTATGSLLHLVTSGDTEVPLMSWVNTSVEIAVMLPIVISSALLAHGILLRCPFYSSESSSDTTKLENLEDTLLYECASLSQISVSSRYSLRIRKGAQLLRNGTMLLLSELTAECFIMLRYHRIGTDMTHDVYKWGTHICVMYIFCVVMCVETPFIYAKARKLLMIACPAGSLVALWQLSTLARHTTNIRESAFDQLVVFLLLLRIISGVIQVVGLIQLENLQPERSKTGSVNTLVNPGASGVIKMRLRQLRRVLLGVYLPTMVVYIVGVSFMGICNPPMVSKSVLQNECSEDSLTALSLAQTWPGLGLIFHFGMITVIFAATGARESMPSYKPSLSIASLFSIHVSILILVHLCWDAVQTDMWSDLSTQDLVRRFLVLAWMVASALMYFCCERVLQVRVDAV